MLRPFQARSSVTTLVKSAGCDARPTHLVRRRPFSSGRCIQGVVTRAGDVVGRWALVRVPEHLWEYDACWVTKALRPGDSGGLWYNEHGAAVGLLIGVSRIVYRNPNTGAVSSKISFFAAHEREVMDALGAGLP